MKLIQYAMGNMDVPGIYPVMALFVFLILFLVIVWHTWSLKQKFVDQMAELPLSGETDVNESLKDNPNE